MQFAFDKKIIYLISSERWGIMKLSKHHYALELAEMGNTVYFIEPPDLGAEGIRIEAAEGTDNLFIVKYKPLYRGERFLPAFVYRQLIRLQALRLLKAIGKKPDVLWCFAPYQFHDLRYFGAALNIFHMVDFSTKPYLPREAASAHICFGVTESLVEYLRPAGKPVYFINHGLSKRFIENNTQDHRINGAAAGPEKNGISVGYIGNLMMEAIDRVTVKKVIEDHPEIRFIFWGQYKPGQDKLGTWNFPEVHQFIEELQHLPNVTLRGPVAPEVLSVEMKTADLFWLCYKKGAGNLWEASNSHKLLEYLVTGKPTITHKVETYEQYEDIFYMVHDMHNKNYPALFDKILGNLDHYSADNLRRKRIEMAITNSYRNHIITIADKINVEGL